jgi:hypothetical protein
MLATDWCLGAAGSENRLERKIKIREPDSPYEQNGQLSAWNAETSVLISDLFGGCPQVRALSNIPNNIR